MIETKLKDIYLVAYLLNENQHLLRMVRDKEKFWFIFQETDKLNILIDDYWQGKALTNIKAYVDKIRDLKDRIFSEK